MSTKKCKYQKHEFIILASFQCNKQKYVCSFSHESLSSLPLHISPSRPDRIFTPLIFRGMVLFLCAFCLFSCDWAPGNFLCDYCLPTASAPSMWMQAGWQGQAGTTDSESCGPGFQSQLCHFLAAPPWASHLIPLCGNFRACSWSKHLSEKMVIAEEELSK